MSVSARTASQMAVVYGRIKTGSAHLAGHTAEQWTYAKQNSDSMWLHNM